MHFTFRQQRVSRHRSPSSRSQNSARGGSGDRSATITSGLASPSLIHHKRGRPSDVSCPNRVMRRTDQEKWKTNIERGLLPNSSSLLPVVLLFYLRLSALSRRCKPHHILRYASFRSQLWLPRCTAFYPPSY